MSLVFSPLVIGVDPSTAASGLAHVDDSFSTVRPVNRHPPQSATERARRLHDIGEEFATHLRGKARPQLAMIEGYSLGGARGYASAYVAEVGGELRRRLFLLGTVIVEVPPTRLKKYATGDGGKKSGKKQIRAAALLDIRLRGPFDAPTPTNDDEGDAYWLRRIGLDVLDPPDEAHLPTALRQARQEIRRAYVEVLSPCSPTS